MKSKTPRRVATTSFDSRPLPRWAGRAAIIAVVGVPAAIFGVGLLTDGSGGPADFDSEREAVFISAESQLAEFETGKGASPDDPKLRKVAASIASDRPSNPLLAAKSWVRAAVSKPDPCDESELRKQLLRERIALVELESMTRSPIQKADAQTVLTRLDGNFESHRYNGVRRSLRPGSRKMARAIGGCAPGRARTDLARPHRAGTRTAIRKPGPFDPPDATIAIPVVKLAA